MSDKKIVVPEGMVKAVDYAISKARGIGRDITGGQVRDIALEVALRWLSNNPILPTMEQAKEMSDSGHPCILDGVWYATEWQKRMFLAPEPNVPQEIADMLQLPDANVLLSISRDSFKEKIIEAYLRGQKSARLWSDVSYSDNHTG